LAWAGVSHWFVLAVFGVGQYQAVFHSIAQIQGFMMCFAVGFLFTAIPRRTGTPPATAWEMAVGLAAPAGTTITAWFSAFAASQVFWLVLVLTLAQFAIRRFLAAEAKRRPPNSFVWVPLSLGVGVAGAGFIAAFGILGQEYFGLHEFGKGLLLQGMFLGLVIGVGGMVLPLITCGDAPPDGAATARDHAARGLHGLGALTLAGSFWVETQVAQQPGLALRAALEGRPETLS